jgi:hypothetical protein
MFTPYLTLQGTSVDFPQPSHFYSPSACDILLSSRGTTVRRQPQDPSTYVTPRLLRATYPVAVQHAVQPQISHCYTDSSSGVLGGDGLCCSMHKGTRSLETSGTIHPATQCHSPEDRNRRLHRWGNLQIPNAQQTLTLHSDI